MLTITFNPQKAFKINEAHKLKTDYIPFFINLNVGPGPDSGGPYRRSGGGAADLRYPANILENRVLG